MLARLRLARSRWQQRVQWLYTMGPRTTAGVCTALFVIVAVVDYLTPPVLNLTFAYVLVILLATWNIGTGAGAAFAALSSLMQVIAVLQLATVEKYSVYWWMILGNRVFTFAVVVALTAPLRKLYDRERINARIDGLTGAVNRKHFDDLLATEISRSLRSGEAFTVAYIDCDDFKAVNDAHGHVAGDELLRGIVASMRRALRVTDVASRIGGDEFAILFPRTEGSEALRALERIRADLRQVFGRNRWQTSLSIGAATFRRTKLAPADIVAACDALMYRAKSAGKDRVVYELVPAEPVAPR